MLQEGFKIPGEVLLFRTDRLGELLLTLPVVRILKDSYPGCRITLVVNPLWEPLARRIPWIDRVIGYQEKSQNSLMEGWRLARVVKKGAKGNYDVSIAFHPKKCFNLASILLGIPTKIGYDRKWALLLTQTLTDKKYLGEKHEVEYNIDLLRLLPGIEIPRRIRLFFPVSDIDRQTVSHRLEQEGVLADEPLIAIHPMTSDPRPWLSPKKFQSVANEIYRRRQWRTVWVGSSEETKEIDPLVTQLGQPHLNLAGELNLGELGALLGRCKLLVSMDSGPVHIAAAVGTPTVVIFGKGDNPGQPRRWGPWGNRHELLYRTSIAERERGYSVEEIMVSVERCLH